MAINVQGNGAPRACRERRGRALLLGELAADRLGILWGLLWVVCIKMAANGEQSCYRPMFNSRL
jgi:hypothetical protein